MSKIDFQTLPDNALVRQRDLLDVLPFSAATLWRCVRSGDFPEPIRVAQGITAWRWGDVSNWLNTRYRTAAESTRSRSAQSRLEGSRK